MLKLRIAEIMESKGMTTQALKERAGIAYGTALDLKKGSARRIDLATLDKVCSALGASPGELFLYVPDEPAASVAKPSRPRKRKG